MSIKTKSQLQLLEAKPFGILLVQERTARLRVAILKHTSTATQKWVFLVVLLGEAVEEEFAWPTFKSTNLEMKKPKER